ncbi:hypothetical protein NC969_15360 [Leptolyngbya subtilissima ST-M1]
MKRTRVPHSTDLVVDWLTHSGSSHEFSSGLERLEPSDPRVVALTKSTKSKAGRPAKWSGPTTPIRVPQHLAEHLLAIARELDSPESANNVQNPSGLPICKPAADAATIAQGLAEGWISHKLPEYPLKMLTSESPAGTYRLFLGPPPDLPPQVEASIEEYCDRVFDGLTETDWVYLLTRLVEEWGERVDA